MLAKAGWAALATIAVFGSVSVAIARPETAARVVTGFASHTVCTKVFVSRLDPDRLLAEMMEATAGSWLVSWGLDLKVDRPRGEVVVTLFGGAAARAQFRKGFGCVLDHGSHLAWVAAAVTSPLAGSAEPALVETQNPAIAAALDRVFAEDAPVRKNTKAVLVMKDGRIIAERYAPDHDVDTPIMGFSATKSAFNALAGILVRDGRLKLDAPAPIAQWQRPGDARGGITIDHLMRHTAGLAMGSSLTASLGSAWEPVNRMKFMERDMAAFAADATPRPRPAANGIITTATRCCWGG